jgi:hypothetical protein
MGNVSDAMIVIDVMVHQKLVSNASKNVLLKG